MKQSEPSSRTNEDIYGVSSLDTSLKSHDGGDTRLQVN